MIADRCMPQSLEAAFLSEATSVTTCQLLCSARFCLVNGGWREGPPASNGVLAWSKFSCCFLGVVQVWLLATESASPRGVSSSSEVGWKSVAAVLKVASWLSVAAVLSVKGG